MRQMSQIPQLMQKRMLNYDHTNLKGIHQSEHASIDYLTGYR